VRATLAVSHSEFAVMIGVSVALKNPKAVVEALHGRSAT
jgi:hypothetical protein